VATAGAELCNLPAQREGSDVARDFVYGYLLATVAPDGTIAFQFKEIQEPDIPAGVVHEFSPEQVKWCFEQNRSQYRPAGPACSTIEQPASDPDKMPNR
jgi:hypothetical protein